jgi:hypothetical protein
LQERYCLTRPFAVFSGAMKANDRRPQAQDVMLGHITSYWISQLVFVAAKLGLADALAKGPLKYILHDWNDEQCLRILSNCRAAMAPGGRVLVIEHVIRPGNAPDWGKLLDINMLALTGGQERRRKEFRDLFERAGLRLKRVHPTASALSILEAGAVT